MKLDTYRGHAIAVVNRGTHYCGYVDVQRDYSHVDELYQIPLDAPGGITYRNGTTVGFDTGHAGHLNIRRIGDDETVMNDMLLEPLDSVTLFDEERVLDACRDIVDQLDDLEERCSYCRRTPVSSKRTIIDPETNEVDCIIRYCIDCQAAKMDAEERLGMVNHDRGGAGDAQ